MNHYLYEITNSITQEKYIGKRSCECDIDKDKYKGEDTALSREFRKYGKKQFKKRVLAIIPDEEVTEDLLSIYLKLDKYTLLKESKLGYYKGPRSNTGSKNPSARKVICLNTEEIFETITSAAQKYHISKSAIILACNPNHGNKYAGRNDKGEFLKWMYYDAYIALQNGEEYIYMETVN